MFFSVLPQRIDAYCWLRIVVMVTRECLKMEGSFFCVLVFINNRECCSMYASGVMTHRRSRQTNTACLCIRCLITVSWVQSDTTMAKAHIKNGHAQLYVFADHSSAATRLHFDGEALINSSQTQRRHPPLLLVVLLLTRGHMAWVKSAMMSLHSQAVRSASLCSW